MNNPYLPVPVTIKKIVIENEARDIKTFDLVFNDKKDSEGTNLVIIGGGFAFTTLRSLTRYVLHEKNRNRFKDITILYGARSPGELIYKSELKQWEERNDISGHLTVDRGGE